MSDIQNSQQSLAPQIDTAAFLGDVHYEILDRDEHENVIQIMRDGSFVARGPNFSELNRINISVVNRITPEINYWRGRAEQARSHGVALATKLANTEGQLLNMTKAAGRSVAEHAEITSKLQPLWCKVVIGSKETVCALSPPAIQMIEHIREYIDRVQAPTLTPMQPTADAAVKHIIEQNHELRSSMRDSHLMYERATGEIRKLTGEIDRHVRDRSEVNKQIGELGKQVAAAKEDARQASLKLGQFKTGRDKLEAERNALRDTCVRLENEVARLKATEPAIVQADDVLKAYEEKNGSYLARNLSKACSEYREQIHKLRNEAQSSTLRESDLSARLADAKRRIQELENGFVRKEVSKPQLRPAPTHSEAYKAAQQHLNQFQTKVMHGMGSAHGTADGKITGMDHAKPGADRGVMSWRNASGELISHVAPRNLDECADQLGQVTRMLSMDLDRMNKIEKQVDELKAEVRAESAAVDFGLDEIESRADKISDRVAALDKRYIELEHASNNIEKQATALDNRYMNDYRFTHEKIVAVAKAAHDRMDTMERRGKAPAGTIADNSNNECSRLAAENSDLRRLLAKYGINVVTGTIG